MYDLNEFPQSAQKEMSAMRMVPMNFDDPQHELDKNTLGKVSIQIENVGEYFGTGIKIGKSCVLTSAHILYQDIIQIGVDQ